MRDTISSFLVGTSLNATSFYLCTMMCGAQSLFTLGEDGTSHKVTLLSPQPLGPMCPTNSSRHGIVGTSPATAFLFTLHARL